jgi:hypothetical protein
MLGIGITLPAAEADEPAVRHRLRAGRNTDAAFRIGIFRIVKLVAFGLGLAHSAAGEAKRTRNRFFAIFVRLRKDRRKQVGRRLGFDQKISAPRIGVKLGGRQGRLFESLLPKEIAPPSFQTRSQAIAVDFDGGAFPLANDLDRGFLVVAEIDLDQAGPAARLLRLPGKVFAVAEIDFHAAVFVGHLRPLDARGLPAAAVDFDRRAAIARRAIVARYGGIAARHQQKHDPKNQPSGSRSGHWARRRHREAKDDGNRFALASLRGRRKKGSTPPTHALDLDPAPDLLSGPARIRIMIRSRSMEKREGPLRRRDFHSRTSAILV